MKVSIASMMCISLCGLASSVSATSTAPLQLSLSYSVTPAFQIAQPERYTGHEPEAPGARKLWRMTTALAIDSGTLEELNSYGGLVCLTGADNFTATDGLPTALSGITACPTTDSATAPANTNVVVLQWLDVPEDQCIDLVTATLDGSRDVYIGTTAIRDAGVNDVAAMQTACTAANLTTVSWVIEQR